MRRVSRADWPLLKFVRSVRRERDVGAALLAGAMVLYAAFALAVATVPSASGFMMERFHLRTSFAAWALLQPYPWMYNFDNAFLIREHPLSAQELRQRKLGRGWRAVNHQSARVVTFVDHRIKLLGARGTRYVYLASRYRGSEVVTAYRLRLPDAAGRPASLSPMDAP